MPATGPSTEAGKAASSRNAVKHGLLSEAPVVTCLESQEDWQSYRDGVVADLVGAPASGTSPTGMCHLPFGIGHSMQFSLAERAALLMWRLRRVACAEADAVNAGLEELELDHKLVDARESAEYHGAVVALARGLAELPDEHALPNHVVSLYIDCACHSLGLDSTRIAFPGVGKSESWGKQLTAAQVREAMAYLAAMRGMEVGAVYRHGLSYCESEAESPLRKYAELALKRDHRARARSLPDEKRLETLSRYEAHLGRELARTMKALKDLQSRPAAGTGQSEISIQESTISNDVVPQDRSLNGSTPLTASQTPAVPANSGTIQDFDCLDELGITLAELRGIGTNEAASAAVTENYETNSTPTPASAETPSLQHSTTPADLAPTPVRESPLTKPAPEYCETNPIRILTPEELEASFYPPSPTAEEWAKMDRSQVIRLGSERERIYQENKRRYEESLALTKTGFSSSRR